jgi:molybdopterin converting factor small subunit
MLWFIQNIIFSISLIVVIHYLYVYFETTLTAPKVKDLIHCPKQKYKSLFDTINKNLDNNKQVRNLGGDEVTAERLTNANDADVVDLLPKNKHNNDPYNNANKDNNDMKTDLKAFLRGIGLKSKSNSEALFRPSYEMS